MPRPDAHVDALRAGEAFFLACLRELDDAALDQPSLLPEWDRRHVVAHIARNADALRNLLTWARTGVETPMYVSAAARAEGIETTAAMSAGELRRDVGAASADLMTDVESLPDDAWQRPVRTARGREITAADIPWMRIRESWIHAVDLGGRASFGDVPRDLVTELLDDVTGGFRGREDCAPMSLRERDSAQEWRIGAATGHAVVVEGTGADLLGWLLGRADGRSLASSAPGGTVPTPPAWL